MNAWMGRMTLAPGDGAKDWRVRVSRILQDSLGLDSRRAHHRRPRCARRRELDRAAREGCHRAEQAPQGHRGPHQGGVSQFAAATLPITRQ